MWWQTLVPLPKRHLPEASAVFFQQHCFSASNESKFKKQGNQHTLENEGKTAVWQFDLLMPVKNTGLVPTCMEILSEEKIGVLLFQWTCTQKSTHTLCFYLNIWSYICKTIDSSVITLEFRCFTVSFKTVDSCNYCNVGLKALNVHKLTHAFSVVPHSLTALHWSGHSNPQL